MVIKMYKQWIFIIIWNVFVFLIYGIDKKKAKKQKWRIPEKTLLMLAFLFGAPGASLGMRFFHHKTKKMKFKINEIREHVLKNDAKEMYEILE